MSGIVNTVWSSCLPSFSISLRTTGCPASGISGNSRFSSSSNAFVKRRCTADVTVLNSDSFSPVTGSLCSCWPPSIDAGGAVVRAVEGNLSGEPS